MNKRGFKKDGTFDLRGAKRKHGLTNHRLYDVWSGMKKRCYAESNRAYKWYGALGIIICAEWLNDFAAFYNWALKTGYAEGLTIERSDSSGNYSPDNCKWIPQSEQPKNRRSCYKIEYQGMVKTLADWCRYLDLDYMLIYQRIAVGWPFEDAISKVSLRGNKKLST